MHSIEKLWSGFTGTALASVRAATEAITVSMALFSVGGGNAAMGEGYALRLSDLGESLKIAQPTVL